MSILIFTELHEGAFKKSAFEVSTYGRQLAMAKGVDFFAVALGSADATELKKLGDYGVKKVYHVNNAVLNQLSSKAYAIAITQIAEKVNADTVIVSHNSVGKTIAPRLAVKLNAALLPGISALPHDGMFAKTVYSGKAFVQLKATTERAIISVNPNSIKPETAQTETEIETVEIALAPTDIDYKIVEIKAESTDHIPLPEAELVVSAGRGMKGPENWGIVEDLAKAIGATTACSRPVADIGWRPHHEHVGQTGITIKPTLYIAIGISGAIQHLAGVNQSKCIVVINKDPEAPFFKAADYGIVGDAFEVVPKLTQAILKLKSN